MVPSSLDDEKEKVQMLYAEKEPDGLDAGMVHAMDDMVAAIYLC